MRNQNVIHLTKWRNQDPKSDLSASEASAYVYLCTGRWEMEDIIPALLPPCHVTLGKNLTSLDFSFFICKTEVLNSMLSNFSFSFDILTLR